MAHEIELEYTDKRLSKRETVRYHRRRSAWLLASKLGDVTKASYDKAFRLLDRCKNVALGFSHLDELENETNWAFVDAKCVALTARMERLNKELAPYGCKMLRTWCIEDVYDYDFERNLPTSDYGYLHFFD
jgi:hypothetical protein